MAGAEKVESRVSFALSDLHAEDGRYHKDCYSQFYTNPSKSTSRTTPDDDQALTPQLLEHMLIDKRRIWNSVELHDF